MRYKAGHKGRTRARILTAAQRALKREGLAGASVSRIMGEAGLTHGGFYQHFPTKEALVAAAFFEGLKSSQEELLQGLEEVQGRDFLAVVVGRYLSRTHRDHPEAGCPMAALLTELGRGEGDLAEPLCNYLEGIAAALAERVTPPGGIPAEERALATLALMVGGVALARATGRGELSDRILRSCRRMALAGVGEEPPKQEGKP